MVIGSEYIHAYRTARFDDVGPRSRETLLRFVAQRVLCRRRARRHSDYSHRSALASAGAGYGANTGRAVQESSRRCLRKSRLWSRPLPIIGDNWAARRLSRHSARRIASARACSNVPDNLVTSCYCPCAANQMSLVFRVPKSRNHLNGFLDLRRRRAHACTSRHQNPAR